MRTTLLGISVTLLSCAVALLTANAHAQEAAPAPAAPAEAAPPPAATPAPEAPPPAAPPPEPATPVAAGAATEAAAEPAPAAEPEVTPAAGWFRLDSDLFNIQLWAGATHPLIEGLGLATDIYVSGALGEFDIGPAITAGPFTLTPMIGLQVDWASRQAASIVPQLYLTGGPDPIYMELWVQDYENQVFDAFPNHDLYTRLFIDYKVSKFFALGPQVEPWFALNKADAEGNPRKTGLMNLAVGGNVMLTNYGKGGTLLLFAGYETKKSARDAVDGHAFAGRFTFLYNF
jgi:hypothetical protein